MESWELETVRADTFLRNAALKGNRNGGGGGACSVGNDGILYKTCKYGR